MDLADLQLDALRYAACVAKQGKQSGGTSRERLLELYPYLTDTAIDTCLRDAAAGSVLI